jgi:hypothetical protein
VTATPVLGDRAAGPWFRVLSLPPPAGPPSPGQDYQAVLPAAATAARQGRPLVTGWLCRGPGHPLELITNAAAPAPGGWELLFPPGARGEPAACGWLAAWERLVWAPCAGRQAPPLAAAPAADPGHPSQFEAALAGLAGAPLGWLVVAEPAGLLPAEVAKLRAELNVLRRQDEEGSRFGAERAGRRLAELDAYAEAGLWQARVLAGAATEAGLAVLAPVLAGSAGLSHHPYRLAATRAARSLAEALRIKMAAPEGGGEVPFPVTAGVLAALAGLPRHELPGVRVIQPACFDLTSEAGSGQAGAGVPGQGSEPAVSLGAVLDGRDRPAGEFSVPLSTLNRHTFVAGATGAGKSQTVRHLLEQLTQAGLPWLAIEPVKSEYPGMAGRLAGAGPAGQVTVISPADPQAVPLSVNPLAPEPGYPVQAHIDMVRALFLAAFDADEPFPQIIAQALDRVYRASGWDVVTGGRLPGAPAPPAIPTLSGLQRAALAVIADVGYGRELAADVRGFVDVRLRSLRTGAAGRFFEGGHPADIAALLRRNVVLAIEDIANDEDKAFLMGTLIIRIVEHLRLRARAEGQGGLRHVIVIEEAHRLLRARGERRASAHAVELFAHLLAEIRAYGEGLVIAEQIPAKLVPDVIKNTALKIIHRLPAADDRELVGAAMNLDPAQSRQVVALPPGVAAVFADGMDRPLRVRVPYGGGRERPLPGPPPPAAGRRSPACGARCAAGRPCTGAEIRAAALLAAPEDPRQAWLRVWTETLVLAFLVGRALPGVPAPVAARWHELSPRLAGCLLATLADRAVGVRAEALRPSYDPGRLAAAVARAGARLLGEGTPQAPGSASPPPGSASSPGRPGPDWVIPPLRWLHEVARLCPPDGGSPEPAATAPPPDFELPGLACSPGMLVGHRLWALRRHPLSAELGHNRLAAWTALLGEDDQAGFAADLATVAVGLPPGAQLPEVAKAMSAGWLEAVLSWPRRFVAEGPGWLAEFERDPGCG